MAELLTREDGGFEVSAQCGSMEIAARLAHIPCKLKRRATGHEPMVDGAGEEVDVEYTWATRWTRKSWCFSTIISTTHQGSTQL